MIASWNCSIFQLIATLSHIAKQKQSFSMVILSCIITMVKAFGKAISSGCTAAESVIPYLDPNYMNAAPGVLNIHIPIALQL
ncbi:hypothetical protein L1987_45335 [Smallanthus sonchifolius]|uniref:Uncharacterized protein n=1 Tax=Smallanthus sonchifolius TaxID=185202 RepID=A0ACB9GSL9_9ASTR|nr:hypothetical protein L1987_45335 [Smallanthus sonchifolius]